MRTMQDFDLASKPEGMYVMGLGRGGPGGPQHYGAAFEDSAARAAERRERRSREGSTPVNPHVAQALRWVASAIAIALMAYAVAAAWGIVAGVVVGVLLVVGAVLLWRLWR